MCVNCNAPHYNWINALVCRACWAHLRWVQWKQKSADWIGRIGLVLVCPAVAHKCLTDGPSVHQADKQQRRRRVLFNVSVELQQQPLGINKNITYTHCERAWQIYVCMCVCEICIYLLTNCWCSLSFSLCLSTFQINSFPMSSFVFFKPNLRYLYVTWNCLLYMYVCVSQDRLHTIELRPNETVVYSMRLHK